MNCFKECFFLILKYNIKSAVQLTEIVRQTVHVYTIYCTVISGAHEKNTGYSVFFHGLLVIYSTCTDWQLL